nr:flagellar biosynthesis regulator FlaF [Belnapia moabensis]
MAISRPRGAATAYGSVIRQTETPRDIEYRVLSNATALLQDACRFDADPAALSRAIHENYKVWSAFAVDLAAAGNAWDDVSKARLFSLARWVLLEGDRVMRERASPNALIDVNHIIMQGLKPMPTTQESAT